jgi:tetratricopeptide (TPR) repeat protein
MTEQATQQDAARRATELFQRGFPRAAIDVLEAELARQPEEGALWRLRAVLLQREGRQAEAFDNIQRALALVPLGYEGLLVLAAGYVRHGHRASAASLLADLTADPEFPAELWEPLYNGLCWPFAAAPGACGPTTTRFASPQRTRWRALVVRRNCRSPCCSGRSGSIRRRRAIAFRWRCNSRGWGRSTRRTRRSAN